MHKQTSKLNKTHEDDWGASDREVYRHIPPSVVMAANSIPFPAAPLNGGERGGGGGGGGNGANCGGKKKGHFGLEGSVGLQAAPAPSIIGGARGGGNEGYGGGGGGRGGGGGGGGG